MCVCVYIYKASIYAFSELGRLLRRYSINIYVNNMMSCNTWFYNVLSATPNVPAWVDACNLYSHHSENWCPCGLLLTL